MTEHPPPERSPEPLSFDPAARSAQPPRPPAAAPSNVPPTRSGHRALIGQTIGDRYRVVGILGEGGMGTVYEAEHLGLGRAVAIKVLNPAQAKKRVAVKRFQQEARAAGAIGHPNICEVYDLGQLDDASPFLVMEKLVGQTLADRISRDGGLPFDELSDILIQVLSGLIAAHDKGIVHRDIKPENIFLARRVGCPPIAKILDFGVSKMMPSYATGEDLDLTRTGMVMGTPYYMSPEQARGQRDLDGRVDVYACGVMMYEAIAGKRPFLAPNYNALLLAIINTSPKPLVETRPATPPEVEAIVRRAMAKHRDDRYVSAMQMMRDLQALELGRSGGRAGSRERRDGRSPALFATRDGDLARAASAPPSGVGPTPPPPRPSARDAGGGPGAAAATLSRGMSERRIPIEREQTRVDVPLRSPRDGRTPSDSIDIPIDVGEDAPLAARAGEFDDFPTEILRQDMAPHPRPRPAAGAPAVPPPKGAAPPQAPPQKPPPPSRGLPEDWEGETVVRRPADLMSPAALAAVAAAAAAAKHRAAAAAAAKQTAAPDRPFNPDETIKLDSVEIEIDLSDETRVQTPRRR